MSSTAEYDGFGPWIYEIRSREEVPRLFRDYPLDLENAVLTIKVPRVIERRDANPAMDLYDMLLSLGREKVTVLTRSGHEYSYRDVAYSEVQGITDSTDLLDGRLVLSADDGDVEVKFNASSVELIAHLVKLLRARYVTATAGAGPSDRESAGAQAPTHGLETDLVNYCNRLAKEGPGGAVVVQKRHGVTAPSASLIEQVVARAWPTALQGSVHSLGQTEYQVVHRGRPFVTGFKPVHALARTLIPLERVTGIETNPHVKYAGVSSLVVRVGKVAHEFVLDQLAAEAAARALRGAVLNG